MGGGPHAAVVVASLGVARRPVSPLQREMAAEWGVEIDTET